MQAGSVGILRGSGGGNGDYDGSRMVCFEVDPLTDRTKLETGTIVFFGGF
jgi:hypothetical protein